MSTTNLVLQASHCLDLHKNCLWDLVLLCMQFLHDLVPLRVEIRIYLEDWFLDLFWVQHDRSVTVRDYLFLPFHFIYECCHVLVEALVKNFFLHSKLTFWESLFFSDNLLDFFLTTHELYRSVLFFLCNELLFLLDCLFKLLFLLSFLILSHLFLLHKSFRLDCNKFNLTSIYFFLWKVIF